MITKIKKKAGAGGILSITKLGGDLRKNLTGLLEVIDASNAIVNGIVDFYMENESNKNEVSKEFIKKAKKGLGENARVLADFEELKKQVVDYIDDIAVYETGVPVLEDTIQRYNVAFIRMSLADASTVKTHNALQSKYIATLEAKADAVAKEAENLKEKWGNSNYEAYKSSVRELLTRSLSVVDSLQEKKDSGEECEEEK